MNITQRDNLINRIQGSFNDDAINEIIKRFNENNLSATIKYSLEEFISLLKRMCTQLDNELKTDNWKFLPIGYNEPHEYGNVNIEQNFNQLISHLVNPTQNLGQIDQYLSTLIYYQILNNFWDKSSVKYHTKEGLNIADLSNKSKVLYEQVKDALEKITSAQNQVEELREKINTYSKSFNDKNITASELLQEIDSKSKKIAELLAEASNTENKIVELGKTQEEKLKEVNSNINDYKKRSIQHEEFFSLLQEQIENNQSNSESLLKDSKIQYDFIKSKEEEIVNLTGLATGAALGTKFDLRAEALRKNLWLWRISILAFTILSVSWAIIVFKYFNTLTNPSWLGIIINVIKTSPAFLLLGFVISQYVKERNLEEEYAFKSAVAMTLNAYSDMLQKADADDNKSRQEMLLKSIEQVYSKPRIHSEKQESGLSGKLKELNETAKTIVDSAKSMKS